MRYVGVIPARYHSSRFPGKPLVMLKGKPMIIWVAERSSQALGSDNVFVATDDNRIADCVHDYGFKAVMTSENALTGTDRLWEVAQQIDADIYINVQGDEPLLNSDDILKVIKTKENFLGEVVNGMCPIKPGEDAGNPNIPKVVTTEENRMVYMSRLPIPGSKSLENRPPFFWKQVCIYAFTKAELKAFGTFGRKGYLESFEDIEILRFLELEIPIRMVETSATSHAVDVPEDIPIVEAALERLFHGM